MYIPRKALDAKPMPTDTDGKPIPFYLARPDIAAVKLCIADEKF